MTHPVITRMLLASAVACSLFGFSALVSNAEAACSAPKNLFLNPYNKDSAHHRPIGTGAQYAGDGHPATRDWLKASRFGINPGDKPWGLYLVEAPANGPVFQVGVRAGTPGSQLPAAVRFPREGVTIDFPKNRDGNIAIFDKSSSRFQHLRNYTWNNAQPLGSQYRNYDPRGLGHGTRIGQRLGTSASGVEAPFGILRGFEINQPGHKIEHALQGGFPAMQNCNIMLSREIQLPATSRDGFATNPGNNTGNIPYGALMALPPSVNIGALGLSEPGRRLAEAIRDYGIYVVDNGGCSAGALRADQEIRADIRNKLVNSDIPKIYRHIRMVLNSEWRPNQAAVGGGQPIAPNCAYNAGATSVAAPATGQSSSGTKASSQQSSSGTKAPSQKEASREATTSSNQLSRNDSSGSDAAPRPGTQAGSDWEKAKRHWNWAQMAVSTMQRSAPGTSQYNTAKANYDRSINNYIRLAAKAGVRVDANTSPERAVGGNRADAAALAGVPATGSVQPPSEQQWTSSNGTGIASSNLPPKPGSQAARDWAQAIKFWNWAQMSVPNLQRFAPGTADHKRVKANYERNIGNYIKWAARAGIAVTAEISPEAALG